MSVLSIQVTAPSRTPRTAVRRAGRLLRIELRRNAMLLMLPLAAALFWYHCYQRVMALPPMWNLRAMSLQNDALLDFALPVTGAAAWMGWRESRRHLVEMLASTARARWARNLGTWAATTCWAMLCYLACVGVVYAITARQASWGGPLWWPLTVGAVGIPALTAFGFAAGMIFPTRFTAPVAILAAFFGLGLAFQGAQNVHSYWQVSPLVSGAAGVGADPGVATFYRYLPDLSIAQVMFLAGLTVTSLGLVGLRAGGGWRLTVCAAALAAVGLAASGTAVGLVGTARLDAHGMTVIPALHDAGSGQPAEYVPVCGETVIRVCVNPAYVAYLPTVLSDLAPVLGQVAGLPGYPATLNQVAQTYVLGARGEVTLPAAAGPPEFTLPAVPGVPGTTNADFASQLDANVALPIVADVIGVTPHGPLTPAQQAIVAALTKLDPRTTKLTLRLLPRPGSPAALAAHRFAALPAAARHAWLVKHISDLRAGGVTLAQIP
jgi:hypothetical protein